MRHKTFGACGVVLYKPGQKRVRFDVPLHNLLAPICVARKNRFKDLPPRGAYRERVDLYAFHGELECGCMLFKFEKSKMVRCLTVDIDGDLARCVDRDFEL